jgi:hypothetical protein
MSVKHLFLECLAMLLAVSAGCVNPVVTGGNVEFKVYRADESINSLLRTQDNWGTNNDMERKGVVSKSHLVPRFVVIPQYDKYKEPRFLAAQAVTSDKNHVVYPRRLGLAVWQGREALPWNTYPSDRAYLNAWVFAEGCWPVYISELDDISDLMNGAILSRWRATKNNAVPFGLEGKALAICFPLNRPWDREVAAAAGCRVFKYVHNKVFLSRVGSRKTLESLAYVPCDLIAAVDQSKELSDADRLMVFRHVLRLYEHTKPRWTGPGADWYGAQDPQAYEKNTKLLRERIATSTDGQGKGAIIGVELPTLSIDDVTELEGDAGQTAFEFTVSLSKNPTLSVPVWVDTADGTARSAGGDYNPISALVMMFDSGDPLTQTFTVQVNGDTEAEGDETFYVNLTSMISRATISDSQGIATIRDDEVPMSSIGDASGSPAIVSRDTDATGRSD